MANNEKLYLTQEDLYRFGNASSSRLNRLRIGEINTMEQNGITMIIANNKGVSLFNEEGMNLSPLTGWVWEIKQNTALPQGLKLIKKGSKGHHMLVPLNTMPLSRYISLLEQIAIHCKKIFKKTA